MSIEITQGEEYLESVEIRHHVLNPMEAELHVYFALTRPLEGAELRGRLHGPICPGTDTVQIAYPIKKMHHPKADGHVVVGRIVIPEPSLWDPITPFVYRGFLEIWKGQGLLAKVRVEHQLIMHPHSQ